MEDRTRLTVYFDPPLHGVEEWATLALPLGGMKARVEYHTLTSPKKMLHGVSKLALRGGASP